MTYVPFTVSSFADWVFRREVPYSAPVKAGSAASDTEVEERLARGLLTHQEIEEIRRDHFPYGWKVEDKSLWSEDYCDMGESSAIFEASSLIRSTDNTPLRGKPDLVLTNEPNQHVIIFERKTTNKDQMETRFGKSNPATWPNCQAQLWAYAQLDKYRSFGRISLVLQVWHRDEYGRPKMGDTVKPWTFCIGDSFDRTNLKRFEGFGGVRVGEDDPTLRDFL